MTTKQECLFSIVVCTILLVFPALIMPGCAIFSSIPDQSQFASLTSLADNGQAVVRLYAAPIPGIEAIAAHPWFVVKRADETTFDRWEVWQTAGGSYGHVRKNRTTNMTGDVGAGGTYIIAELIGTEAEAVVAFIEAQSPDYSCQDNYVLLGPNSNTYAQWVLDGSGWDVSLPPTAIGMDAPQTCS